jgi:hypothetical protein
MHRQRHDEVFISRREIVSAAGTREFRQALFQVPVNASASVNASAQSRVRVKARAAHAHFAIGLLHGIRARTLNNAMVPQSDASYSLIHPPGQATLLSLPPPLLTAAVPHAGLHRYAHIHTHMRIQDRRRYSHLQTVCVCRPCSPPRLQPWECFQTAEALPTTRPHADVRRVHSQTLDETPLVHSDRSVDGISPVLRLRRFLLTLGRPRCARHLAFLLPLPFPLPCPARTHHDCWPSFRSFRSFRAADAGLQQVASSRPLLWPSRAWRNAWAHYIIGVGSKPRKRPADGARRHQLL